MMPPKRRKHCRSLPHDVLSNLPDNIIDVILMHLPCNDAVRTSVLSKKWRYHWCRLTELTLDYKLSETKKDLLNRTVKFTKIIYQLLTLHEGPITKFTLNVVHLESCPEIDNFICFLSRNDIQHLVLHLPFRKIYKLSSSLFTFSQLRHLNLHYCLIHAPSAFQGFDKLISLELCEVTISSELLESLISHCPLLEQLVLDIAEKSDKIEINAPMLRLFDFTGNISSICLKNVPRLVKVYLLGDYIKAEDLDFTKVFESCSALEHLVFDFFNCGFCAGEGYEAPTRLPFNLDSKWQPGALSSRYARGLGKGRTTRVYCTQPYLAFLQEAVSTARGHMTTTLPVTPRLPFNLDSVKLFYLPNIMLVESHKLSFALC